MFLSVLSFDTKEFGFLCAVRDSTIELYTTIKFPCPKASIN